MEDLGAAARRFENYSSAEKQIFKKETEKITAGKREEGDGSPSFFSLKTEQNPKIVSNLWVKTHNVQMNTTFLENGRILTFQ